MRTPSTLWLLAALCLALLAAEGGAQSAPGEVVDQHKISSTTGGFTGVLDDFDLFGYSLAHLGDLDGDGISDVAVGANRDQDGYTGGGPPNGRGAVWILFLEADGTVKSHQKISQTEGGFGGLIGDGDQFGYSCARLGDVDGDGTVDIAVGANRDEDGPGETPGAVWVLFLNSDGTVKAHQKISATAGNFAGPLDTADRFGSSVTGLGDLDGDGVEDLAVGSRRDDDGGTSLGSNNGAVWILFLNTDGTVKAQQKISNTEGGLGNVIGEEDSFGAAVANIGDLDGDGTIDLAVGAYDDDDGGESRGAVWLLLLNPDGTVKQRRKISDTAGGFTGVLDDGDQFGVVMPHLGDLDGDGMIDLVVGSNRDDDGGAINQGSVWVLFLAPDASVKAHVKLGELSGNFGGDLDTGDAFGVSLTTLGDFDGDAVADIMVGAYGDDDGGTSRGAVWMLSLNASAWIDLGAGLAGTSGEPRLEGIGTLVAGDPVRLSLRNALGNSTVFFLTAVEAAFVPFKGGTLVPFTPPATPVPELLSDGQGSLIISNTWPAGVPGDFTTYFQCWIVDPATPFGLSASNGLSARTP